MKETILLSYSEDTKKIEEEEKNKFLYYLLCQMDIPISDFWTDELILSVDQKIKLKKILQAFSISIIDYNDGNMDVYVDNEKIATWNKCQYKLKKDLSHLDKRKQLYLEMTTDYSSIFEDSDK